MQIISAEGAIHWRVESRFQPRKLSGLPQVRHGESVSPADESVPCADLWRTNVRRAPLALNTYWTTATASLNHFFKLSTDYRSVEAIDGDACLAEVPDTMPAAPIPFAHR